MTTIAERQNHTEISMRWPNPYASCAVYVPLAELVKAYEYLHQMRPANQGGELLVTEDLLLRDWTHDGLFWVDAYIVPQLNGYAAGIRYGEGPAVLTPVFNAEKLEALYNRYCPQVQSESGEATARVKWHAQLVPKLQQKLLLEIGQDETSVSFDAAAIVNLLFKTNPAYAARMVAQAQKANGLAA